MGFFSKSGIIKIDSSAKKEVLIGSEPRVDATDSHKKALPAFFAHESLQTAYVRLKTRLSDIGAHFDPELYVAGVTIALAYVKSESGIFSDFANFMQSCFGDAIKPHLLAFYTGICSFPESLGVTLTSYEDCVREHAVIMKRT